MKKPGPVVLLGSGETTPSGGQVFEELARQLPVPLKISLLETPAGFELNSPRVAGRVADYLRIRLQNYRPDLRVIPARKKGTEFSPDSEDLLPPVRESDMIFLWPGSPTYAARQLKDSQLWQTVEALHRLGAALALASAATIALGKAALPVYEVFKVGEEVHWKPGLDFFAPYGLSLVIIPHWNNSEGGAELDTSHCFIGASRFDEARALLAEDVTVVGIDERTALMIDLAAGSARVLGSDQVHILRREGEVSYKRGDVLPLSVLGDFHSLIDEQAGIPADIWRRAVEAREQNREQEEIETPVEVLELVELRQQARERSDWSRADAIRQQAAGMGWIIQDTPDGPIVTPVKE